MSAESIKGLEKRPSPEDLGMPLHEAAPPVAVFFFFFFFFWFFETGFLCVALAVLELTL
jgi:hypothetical protein